MEREFTKDVGRYKRGTRCGWPLATWQAIAPGVPLHSFSRPLNKDAVRPGDKPVQQTQN